ncbi:MAG TPA: endonuclease domain-containing protein [Microvirga sp.]|nr:endonuclease domain-containing protein [Microvirga sp.]
MSDAGDGGLARFRRRTAQSLRARTTGAEQRLWRALTHVPVKGTHFRRQVPIGPYVVDFACLATRLAIELDGSPHTRSDVAARDAKRQHWLEQEGFRVLRFWNAEVTANLDGVLDTIYAALHGGMAAEAKRITHRRRSRTPPSPGGGGSDRQVRGGVTARSASGDAGPGVRPSGDSPHPACCAGDPPPPGEGGR